MESRPVIEFHRVPDYILLMEVKMRQPAETLPDARRVIIVGATSFGLLLLSAILFAFLHFQPVLPALFATVPSSVVAAVASISLVMASLLGFRTFDALTDLRFGTSSRAASQLYRDNMRQLEAIERQMSGNDSPESPPAARQA